MYFKTCSQCASPFETNTFRQKKCKPSCGRTNSNRARVSRTESHDLEFIGVDGEGINVWEDVLDVDDEGFETTRRERTHHYVLLSVGNASLLNNGKPLTHDAIFGFLWQQFLDHPNAVFVGFFLGYDFTCWLKTIPEHAAKALLTIEGMARRQPAEGSTRYDAWPVRDGHWSYRNGKRAQHDAKWEFDILPGNKRFRLRPYVPYEQVPTHIVTHKDGTQEEKKVARPWLYICDTGPFFQSSFLTAINPRDWQHPIVSQEEYDLIERGKTHRQDAEFNADMIEYNTLENEVLSRLMTRINEGFLSDGIRLTKKQWFGPGQAAQEWMKLSGVPTGEEIRSIVPQWARTAARNTYYGGWFEIFSHGPIPGVSYAYDINSAYPAIIETLPCLLHGEWSQGAGKPPRLHPRDYRMVKATVRGSDEYVGAMPHRLPNGSILRPRKTTGWYWWHEIEASRKAGCISRVEIDQWVNYRPCKCDPPMAGIRQLYEGRLLAGKNSAQGKGKKLVYNSAYGKLAQSVGNPKFSNPIWASLITAGCRTMILDAIATHPTKTQSLLMVATDGIVFKEEHPTLPPESRWLFDTVQDYLDAVKAEKGKSEQPLTRELEVLGGWDIDLYHNLSLFMPGLYWDDKTREMIAKGEHPKMKSRGVAARDLAKVVTRVDKAWGRYGPDHGAPKIRLDIEWALISAKQAITRGKWWLCGHIVYGASRELNGKPDAKRQPHLGSMWGGLRSYPYDDASPYDETTYYDRGFGEEPEDHETDELVTPDGRIGELRAWTFRR